MNSKCPICRTAVTERIKGVWPFCSERCKLIDLGNWASEQYRVPVASDPDEEKPTDDSDSSGE